MSDEYGVYSYDENLVRSCMSVSRRVLATSDVTNTDLGDREREHVAEAEEAWRKTSLDPTAVLASHRQHLILTGWLDHDIPDWPVNMNRFLARSVAHGFWRTSERLVTIAKLGRFLIVGIVSELGSQESYDTEGHHIAGTIGAQPLKVPADLIDYLKGAARYALESLMSISDEQKKSMALYRSVHAADYLKSDAYRIAVADRKMLNEARGARKK